ncbi:MAG: cytochrome c551/c552 [Bacteroidia bacterium]|jgi:cytochrome c551/c552
MLRFFGLWTLGVMLSIGLSSCTINPSKSKDNKETNNGNARAVEIPDEIRYILKKNTCLGCHTLNRKLIGPPFTAMIGKYASPKEIAELIAHPLPSNWPDYPPMIGLTVNDEASSAIADWIYQLKE